jgi:APA family basic amino acid/polyamine antiporter
MLGHSYLARKSIPDAVAAGQDGRLARTLGPGSIIAIGVGAIIGAGIFVLTGTAAAEYAGPAIILSFALAAVACTFVALCYAELASMLPMSGSTYTYTYATMGELAAWIIGWDLILEYTMGAATVAVGWSGYVVSLLQDFGINIPAALAMPPGATATGSDGTVVHGVLNMPAAAIVLVLTGLLTLGTRQSSLLNNVMVSVKLLVVLAFVALGAFYVDSAHWHPFLPANSGEFGHFGLSGVLRGAAVVFFAFLGFDTVSTTAQEALRPQRDVPVGVLGSLVICTLLYIAVAAVLTGIVPFAELNSADPIARGVDAIGFSWFSTLIKAGALTGLTTVILVLLYAQGRIFYSMSEDGLLHPLFATVHPRVRTPYLSQILIGLAVGTLAALLPVGILGEMVSIGTLLAFVLVCIAVLYLRRVEPSAPRPFRVPASPVIPLLGIAFCLLLMTGLPLVTWLRLVVWLAVGLVVYFAYSRHHSRLGRALAASAPPAVP